MPDISKINALAIGSVAKVDGLAKASILDIDGVAVPATNVPSAAFSVRLLGSAVGISSYTGPAIRVRRETAGGAGDDDEADIAFDSGVISLDSAISNASAGVTATTLGQFLNVGTVGGTTYTNPDSLTVTASCFVDEWKDQSGNANHATQATHSSQLQIHSGTVNTDLILANGKPAVKPVDLFGAMEFTMDRSSGEYSMFFVGQVFQRSTIFAGGGTSANYVMGAISGSTSNVNGNLQNTSLFVDGSASSIATSGDAYTAFLNNQSLITLFADHTWTTDDLVIAYVNQFTGGYQNQELIIYTNDQSSNRTAIESNINSEFLIYQPTDAPTSGLLATYTGAAAAYSVRQLSDKAVIALRIRRDSDDEERNIGWDANGDLDTTAISDFCGTANGYVTRWWDQSTNGNHADQPVGGTGSNVNQPQIYNGTAVITENGKTAVQFDGVNDQLEIASYPFTGTDISIFSVVKTTETVAGMNPYSFGDASNIFSLTFNRSTSSSWAVAQSTTTIQNRQGDSYNQAQSLFSQFNTGTTTSGYRNGTQGTQSYLVFGAFSQSTIGSRYNQQYLDGTIQEVILWDVDQDGAGNRTGIELNIDTYFQIP